jgi:hypothetical protein
MPGGAQPILKSLDAGEVLVEQGSPGASVFHREDG